jgi:hypothetical protein
MTSERVLSKESGQKRACQLRSDLAKAVRKGTYPGLDNRLDPSCSFVRCLCADEVTPLCRVFEVGSRQPRLERKDVGLRRTMAVGRFGRHQEDIELSELAEYRGIFELWSVEQGKQGVSRVIPGDLAQRTRYAPFRTCTASARHHRGGGTACSTCRPWSRPAPSRS